MIEGHQNLDCGKQRNTKERKTRDAFSLHNVGKGFIKEVKHFSPTAAALFACIEKRVASMKTSRRRGERMKIKNNGGKVNLNRTTRVGTKL